MNTPTPQLSQFNRRLLAQMVVGLTSVIIVVFIVSNLSSHSANVLRSTNIGTSPAIEAPVPAASTYTVNSVGDVSDTSVGDGHCDTDGNLGNGDQCTLRAAVEEGNFGGPGHSINFSLAAGSIISLNTSLGLRLLADEAESVQRELHQCRDG